MREREREAEKMEVKENTEKINWQIEKWYSGELKRIVAK